jgi:hypothetical protein
MKKTIISAMLLAALPFAAFADSTVTAVAGTGASVTPSGVTVVATGVTQTFSIGAQSGYSVSGVSLDGASLGDVGSVDFIGLALDPIDHTIDVSATANGGGGQPYCSGPDAPGWNVSLPGGGCGSTKTFYPAGSSECPVFDFQGCEVPNK